MPTRRVFVDQPVAAGRVLRLGADASHHVGRVLRCRAGDAVTVFNGDGREYPSRIARTGKSGIELAVGDAVRADLESPLDVRLVQCISRGERMDTVVQKATELGVRRISPVESGRSVVRLDRERADKRVQHWRRISLSACEQCGRNVPPIVDAPASLAGTLDGEADATRLMLEPGAATSLETLAAPARGIELLIGPEGGLTEDESAAARAAGYVAVALGPRTLRTETAAIAALTLVQALWGDLLRRESVPR